jgi:predicted AlkP superfamily pyrophosphatase or phosphodiesterase
VALISVDGLRPDAITEANAPGILGLAERGAYTLAAQTVLPSTTLPSHASMLTGLEPTAHGITFDEYLETFELRPSTTLALAQAAGKHSLMVAGKDKFRQLSPGCNTWVLAKRGDAEVVNEAIVQIANGFDLLFVHLPQVDQAGHASGWMSPEYLAQLRETDRVISRLVEQLPAGTTVILTSDHGGKGKTHGTTDKADMTIPWIASGGGVVRRGPITRLVRTLDTAPTVLKLLGITPPIGMGGNAVMEPFQP